MRNLNVFKETSTPRMFMFKAELCPELGNGAKHVKNAGGAGRVQVGSVSKNGSEEVGLFLEEVGIR